MSVLFLCKLISLNIWLQSLNVDCSRFLCLLWHEGCEENLSFTCLNNFANDSKKPQKLTRFLSGCVFFYTFCQFLLADSYLRAENFTNTCQHARFREHCHDCRSHFTSQVAGPCEGEARNGNESTLVLSYFYELLPPINTDKTWNLSKMCFLHVKVAKRDTQWTEVKAL